MAIGRNSAKLGRFDKAEVAFEAAIAEASRCEMPFIEMLARHDYVVHMLDAAGRREEQMAALGSAISRMVLPPSEYAPVLGPGISAEDAVAAFRAEEHGNGRADES